MTEGPEQVQGTGATPEPDEHIEGLIIPNPVTKMSSDLAGIGAAPGLVMGKAVLVPSGKVGEDEARTIPQSEVPKELSRARDALSAVASALSGADSAEHPVLKLMGQQLEGERWPAIQAGISTLRMSSAEAMQWAFRADLDRMRECEMKDEIRGVIRSLIQQVHQQTGYTRRLDLLEPGSVLVGDDFNATSLRPIGPKSSIISIVTDAGGRMGHVPITCRGQGWPCVTDTEEATKKIKNGDILIVDGSTGKVWVNPNAEIVAWYEKQLQSRISSTDLRAVPSNIVHTKDGRKIVLSCNVDTSADLEKVRLVFPDGMRSIGLFRSEEELLQDRGFNAPALYLQEDAQALIYKAAVLLCGEQGVTIRLIDWNGEKSLTGHRVDNPALGPRGIRHSLMNPDVLMIQLRAICRASAFGPVSVMAPMVTEAAEMVELREYLNKAIEEVSKTHPINRDNIKLGAMIEIGGAAGVMLSKILKEVDFISVGSNDLTQYELGVDRLFTPGDKEGRWERRFGPHHPAVLDKLRFIFRSAAEAGVPASICGELASIPFYLPMCIGSGAQNLSILPRGAWATRSVIAHLNYERCRELVDDMINSKGGEEALDKLRAFNLALTGRKPSGS